MATDAAPKAPVRCAVYTRKSTEEGLEQDFNSLDAQRECCEAYVFSQRQEHWTLVPQRYDDGGFTGANLERPALRQLTADVETGRINCVVVYKVDRLSRSLLDFARLMEVFDERGVTFVSVTQQLNTHSPMGRLTLNVLLSFAQFEREIISERTRDKLSAARRKGKWIGGYPVLGYDPDPQARRLVVNEGEAEQVRQIFAIFLRRGSLAATLEETRQRGWALKSWTTRKGKTHVGKPFDHPALVRLLTNVLYVGEVSHKGKRYPGEHQAIVSSDLWAKVNALLTSHPQGAEKKVKRNRYGAILQGLVECARCGSRMLHGSTTRRGRRYRYYTCLQALKRGASACPGQIVSAEKIEQAVVERLFELVGTGEWQNRPEGFPEGRAYWDVLGRSQQTDMLENVIDRVRYDHSQERAGFKIRHFEGAGGNDGEILVRIRKKNWEQIVARVDPDGLRARTRDRSLPRISRLMALAIRLEDLRRNGTVKDYAELARLGGVSRARITQIMNLRNLTPAIQEQLLFLSAEAGKKINEAMLRRIANETNWRRQAEMFEGLLIL